MSTSTTTTTTVTVIPLSLAQVYKDGFRATVEPVKIWARPVGENEAALGFTHSDTRPGDTRPRHRHPFEQVRYVVSGKMTYSPKQTAEAGDCVYFPESVHYGPSDYPEDGVVFTLQYSGPSEHGLFIEYDRFAAATEELKKSGEFDLSHGGIYRRADGGRAQDSYEAHVEFLTGKPVVYAPPRYLSPTLMRSSQFPAVDLDGVPGVHIKHLGYFNEVGPNVKVLQLDAGATLPAAVSKSRQIWYVISGGFTYEGESYPGTTVLDVPWGTDRGVVQAEEPTEILVTHIGHRNLPPIPFNEF
jgi:mannose-6-phosphate isomerase-like protein (cupin superfamily)